MSLDLKFTCCFFLPHDKASIPNNRMLEALILLPAELVFPQAAGVSSGWKSILAPGMG